LEAFDQTRQEIEKLLGLKITSIVWDVQKRNEPPFVRFESKIELVGFFLALD
jgi:hypothetical protein